MLTLMLSAGGKSSGDGQGAGGSSAALLAPWRCSTTRALAALLLVSTGCSSSYMPQRSPRVQLIERHGAPVFVRDGNVYEGGAFGGGLEDAVRGNPQAEEHARAYRHGMVGGLVATLLGTGLMVGSLATLPRESDREDRSTPTVPLTLFAAGLASYVTGSILLLNAQPHMWDAINIYNDGLPPPYGPRVVHPPYLPLHPPSSVTPPTPGAPKGESLHEIPSPSSAPADAPTIEEPATESEPTQTEETNW